MRVKCSLDRAQDIDAECALLLRHISAVIFTDTMMMADRAAMRDNGLACRGLDGPPLCQFVLKSARKDKCEIEACAIMVGMAEMAHDDTVRPLSRNMGAHCLAECR